MLQTRIKVGFPKSLFINSCLAILVLSCQRSEPDISNSSKDRPISVLASKAKALAYSKPDSAIIYTDSAMSILRINGDVNSMASVSILQNKVDAYLNKGMPDSAVNILERIRSLSINKSDKPALAQAMLKLGEIKADQGRLYQAEKCLLEAISLYEDLKMEFEKGEAITLYSGVLTAKGDNNKSQDYLFKALAIFEKIDSLNAISGVYINIGNNFESIGSTSKAIHYYRMAEIAAKRNSFTFNRVAAYCNIGILYRYQTPDSAMYYYKLALSLLSPEKDLQSYIIAQFNIANLFVDKKDFTTAIKMFNNLIEMCRSAKLSGGLARTYSGLACVYENMGRYDMSVKYNDLGKRIADSIGETRLSNALMAQQAWDYKENGQYKEAYTLTEQLKVINDSILALDKQIAVHDLEMFYQTEKKELENHYLKRSRLFFIIVSVVLCFLLSYLLWIYYSRNKAWNALITIYKRGQPAGKADPVLYSEQQASVLTAETNSASTGNSEVDLQQRLYNAMVNKQLFKDKNLSVDQLAAVIGTSRRELSIYLHLNYNQNYSQYVNQHRIEYACKLLGSDNSVGPKIEYLAHVCGFNSRQVFYQAFNTIVGMSPGRFRQAMVQNTPNQPQSVSD